MRLGKISLKPHINTIIDMKLEQKINEALVAIITSLEVIKAPILHITINYQESSFMANLYYKKQEYKDEKWFYTYLAYDQKILSEFIKNQPLLLGNNILNSQRGLLAIHPHTHQVRISPLIDAIPSDVINTHLVIEEKIEYFNPLQEYSVECIIDSPYMVKKDLVNLSVHNALYDYMADRNEILIYDIGENHMDIGINVTLLQNKRYIARIGDTLNIKKLYFALEKDISVEEIDRLLERILTTAHSYHNRISRVMIKLAYIPANLEIGQQIQYNNKLYFLFKFTIGIDGNRETHTFCELTLEQYRQVEIKNRKVTLVENKKSNLAMEDFLKLEENRLFIREQYRENIIRHILYSV